MILSLLIILQDVVVCSNVRVVRCVCHMVRTGWQTMFTIAQLKARYTQTTLLQLMSCAQHAEQCKFRKGTCQLATSSPLWPTHHLHTLDTTCNHNVSDMHQTWSCMCCDAICFSPATSPLQITELFTQQARVASTSLAQPAASSATSHGKPASCQRDHRLCPPP